MDLLENKAWKILPVACFAVNIAFILINIFIPFNSLLPGDLHTYNHTIVLNSVTALGFLYLIIHPQSLYLYSILCTLNGLINIVEGGSIFGGTLLCVALSVAFRKGFFRTHLKRKAGFLFGILFSAILFQIRFGFDVFLQSSLVIFVLLLMQGFLLLILLNYVSALLPAKRVIILADLDLQERDYDLIKRILNDEKYSFIADSYNLSESAIKHWMSSLYKKFDVKDRNEFMVKCHNSEVIYPDPQPEAKQGRALQS